MRGLKFTFVLCRGGWEEEYISFDYQRKYKEYRALLEEFCDPSVPLQECLMLDLELQMDGIHLFNSPENMKLRDERVIECFERARRAFATGDASELLALKASPGAIQSGPARRRKRNARPKQTLASLTGTAPA